ncbi:MAG TPA: phenylalanine--tRNA ligase subunit alpha [Planktothrix sp.]
MADLEGVLRELAQLEQDGTAAFAACGSKQELEEARVKFTGKNSRVTEIMRTMGALSKEDKPRVGARGNEVQKKLQEAHDARKAELDRQELDAKLATERIDVTLPAKGVALGHLHPLTLITRDICNIFYGLGYTVEDGPEVETDFYNFDALNTPAHHPARDEQDTFYTNVAPHVLLRSQTSTAQIRVMERKKPPLKIIAPGRVYRNEEVNARKYPLFHQVEGLYIDKDVTFGMLKATLTEFIRLLFGKPLKTRFRPDFFPFTEPSAELDSECPFCEGKGCRTCGQRGWLELLGCGMVDPNVLRAVNIDPEVYNGFAFGMGLERIAMLKYDVNDIRNFYTNDMRFLEQF